MMVGFLQRCKAASHAARVAQERARLLVRLRVFETGFDYADVQESCALDEGHGRQLQRALDAAHAQGGRQHEVQTRGHA